MKHCLVFASLISPSKMILFEKKYQTFDTVFHHQMKHLEVRQKYSAARRIFNSLLGVSSGDETLHLMFDILLTTLVVSYFGIFLLYIQEHVLFFRLLGSINVALFANFQRDVLDAHVFICQSLLYLRRERFNTFHSTDDSLNTFNNNNKKKINRKALFNNFHLNAAIHRLKGLNQSRSKALLTIYSVIGM